MIHKVKTFFKLSRSRKILVIQAFIYSVYTFFLFTFFNQQARFGEKWLSGEKKPVTGIKVADMAFAINLAAKYIPWKNRCRHQAYQARLLCDYYKIPCYIYIGLKKDIKKDEIQAHAWVMADGQMIAGFCNPEEYIIQNVYKNKWG